MIFWFGKLLSLGKAICYAMIAILAIIETLSAGMPLDSNYVENIIRKLAWWVIAVSIFEMISNIHEFSKPKNLD